MEVSSTTSQTPVIDTNVRKSNTNNIEHQKHFRESQQSTSHDGVVPDKEEVKSTVEKINKFNDPSSTNLKFVFHEELHEYYVTVINPLTDEIIKEIPPKKMLDMYAAMAEYMGILVDEKI